MTANTFHPPPFRYRSTNGRPLLLCIHRRQPKQTLYAGVTSDLRRRVFQHKQKTHPGFTARYNCNRLVWFESFSEVSAAIRREKEIKGWTRAKKIALIEVKNPTWEDLSEQWYPQLAAQSVG